jgi:RNA polymerase sigma-70 factor (ECF subfamily)
LRAYDFRDEWADLIQEVLIAVIVAARRQAIPDPTGLPHYVRRVTANKFHDRLRRYIRRGEGEDLPWEDAVAPTSPPDPTTRLDVQRALEKLPPLQQKLLIDVYVGRRTYQEAAELHGVPLGSAKRYLRQGLEALRRTLEPGAGQEDPTETE